MQDQSHVGLVYAHAEGVGGHHDPHLVVMPLALAFVFLIMIQAGMVEGGLDACLRDDVAHLTATSAAAHIDDGAARHRAKDMEHLLLLVLRRAHHISQVATFKTHAEHVALAEAQTVLDVVNDLGGGGGGEGKHRHAGLHVAKLCYLQVGGTEIVAPLADAMGLINGYEAHLHVAQLHPEEV